MAAQGLTAVQGNEGEIINLALHEQALEFIEMLKFWLGDDVDTIEEMIDIYTKKNKSFDPVTKKNLTQAIAEIRG